ncbi:MAG: FAD-dependent oxidoreductase, partial [Neisseriaceae bacterium]|nr:FAD-dependent oxidoreductase [Neisseriaceae bacterium]
MTTPLSNRRTFLKTLAALSITLASGTKNALAAVLSPAAPSELAAFKGIIVTRAHANYWHWFMAMTWYREKAKRYPALFAQPHDPDDIRLLLAYARHNQMQVTTRASGHNITMPPLRDNALTIDLSLFNQMEDLDVAAKTVWAEPAITSEELNRRLFAHNLVFPSAHTGFVSIGGYLLGGGMGWNMPAYGMGCSSIIAAQLLLADGRIVLASATENADLFWAMRGAGHGFFAIVLRFKLKLHDAPTAVMNTYFFPLDCLDEAVQETLKLTKANARRSELLAALGKFSPPGTPAEDQSWHWVLNVISYGKNEAEA